MSVNEEKMAWLREQGAQGNTLTDLWFDFLRGRGYTGTLREMKYQFKKDGGVVNFSIGFDDRWKCRRDWHVEDGVMHVNGPGSAKLHITGLRTDIKYLLSFELDGRFVGAGAITFVLGGRKPHATRDTGKVSFSLVAAAGDHLLLGTAGKGHFEGLMKDVVLEPI